MLQECDGPERRTAYLTIADKRRLTGPSYFMPYDGLLF